MGLEICASHHGAAPARQRNAQPLELFRFLLAFPSNIELAGRTKRICENRRGLAPLVVGMRGDELAAVAVVVNKHGVVLFPPRRSICMLQAHANQTSGQDLHRGKLVPAELVRRRVRVGTKVHLGSLHRAYPSIHSKRAAGFGLHDSNKLVDRFLRCGDCTRSEVKICIFAGNKLGGRRHNRRNNEQTAVLPAYKVALAFKVQTCTLGVAIKVFDRTQSANVHFDTPPKIMPQADTLKRALRCLWH
jgi:hypothetical protein